MLIDADRPAPGPRWLGEAGQVALAVALAVVVLPVSWTSIREGEVSSTWTVLLLSAVIVLHTAVLVARRWPVPAYAAGSLAGLVLVAGPDLGRPTAEQAGSDFGPVLVPSSLCFFVLLYGVSARAGRSWANAALAVGLIGSLLTMVRLRDFAVDPLDGWAWWLLLGVATVGSTLAAWALGRFRATRAAWVAQLAERGAAEERRRIAREMHDVVAHSLAVVVSHAEAGRMVVAQDPGRAPQILGTIAETGRGALTEMRGLLGVLRDESGEPRDATAPQPGLAEVPALVERMRAAGQVVVYDDPRLPRDGSPTVQLTAYRLVQEALTNITRHAAPGAVATLSVTALDDALVVEVTDDGGPSPASAPGRGLTGMRERVESVGGTLVAGPTGSGWRVSARLPW